MESNTFKSVAFGGFSKQDVVAYIERTSKEYTSALEQLQQENGAMQENRNALAEQIEALRQKLQAQETALNELHSSLDQAKAENLELCALKPENIRLCAELESLRQDARAYQEIKTRIGEIECEARRRASELETSSNAHLRSMVADFRERYQNLVHTFDTASTYVTGELRKVEVNLSQLPRALDKINVDLEDLENSLDPNASKNEC